MWLIPKVPLYQKYNETVCTLLNDIHINSRDERVEVKAYSGDLTGTWRLGPG